jgi:hypothetical protein
MPTNSPYRAARTGEDMAGGTIMDSSEVFSQFSINRLDGEAVPDDLRILLLHRDELAARSGFRLLLDEDRTPWRNPGAQDEPLHSDPEAVANLRATAEVCRLIAFVAVEGTDQYLGYWRGPANRKVDLSPLVLLDRTGQFHLCASSTFAEAVLERAYGSEDFDELRDWFQSLGLSIGWESPSQLTLPHEKLPPKEMHRQLFDRYRRALLPRE